MTLPLGDGPGKGSFFEDTCPEGASCVKSPFEGAFFDDMSFEGTPSATVDGALAVRGSICRSKADKMESSRFHASYKELMQSVV